MPAFEPRSRSVNREWRADKEWMTTFTAAEREYALLLGLHADDAGYLQWDPDTLLPDIYRWVAPAEREAQAAEFDAHLVASGRLVILECGRHAVLPKMIDRPRAAKPVRSNLDEHVRKCQIGPRSDPGRTQVRPDVGVALHGVAQHGSASASANGGPARRRGGPPSRIEFTDDEHALGASLAQKETNP